MIVAAGTAFAGEPPASDEPDTASIDVDSDISPSEIDWDYDVWTSEFSAELRKHWTAPYSYRIGITSGQTVVTAVLKPDGTIVSVEAVEEEGHASLHRASIEAVRSLSGLVPLPEEFTENTLSVTMTFKYPGRPR